MIDEIKNIKNEKSDFRKFGVTVGLLLMVLSGFFLWKGKESFEPMLFSGLVLCLLGLMLPVALKPVYWIWMVIAVILGWIVTRVILSLLFYVVITPIGMLSRLSGSSFLNLKWNKSKDSYWNSRPTKQRNSEDFEKQF